MASVLIYYLSGYTIRGKVKEIKRDKKPEYLIQKIKVYSDWYSSAVAQKNCFHMGACSLLRFPNEIKKNTVQNSWVRTNPSQKMKLRNKN